MLPQVQGRPCGMQLNSQLQQLADADATLHTRCLSPLLEGHEASVVVAQLVLRSLLQLDVLAVVAGGVGQQLAVLLALDGGGQRTTTNLDVTAAQQQEQQRQQAMGEMRRPCNGSGQATMAFLNLYL